MRRVFSSNISYKIYSKYGIPNCAYAKRKKKLARENSAKETIPENYIEYPLEPLDKGSAWFDGMIIDRNSVVNTQNRQYKIDEQLVGMTLNVHNGMDYKKVKIVPEMVGFSLGSFSPTKKSAHHNVGAKKGR